MSAESRLSQQQWQVVLDGRACKPPTPWRALAAQVGVSHVSLIRRFKRHEARMAKAHAEARALARQADPSKPETMPAPAAAPADAIVLPHGRAVIGSWWTEAPEARGSELLPNAHLVGSKELLEDRAPNRDITDRVRAHPAPDPHRAHR
jgi:hypothetical protein